MQDLKQRVRSDLRVSIPQVAPTGFSAKKSVNQNGQTYEALFIPYWTLSNTKITENFERYIYFGVTEDSSGLAVDEPGYQNLALFLQYVPREARKDMTIRMLDSSLNLATLKDTKKQAELIDHAVLWAKKDAFDGVVLDLELAALPFDSLIKQINDFSKIFYEKTKKENLHFAMTIYGDTFYRVRPFQVKSLQNTTDEIMVMAYDFHKTGGTPGPNFPLNENGIYGYSFSLMLKDFLRFVPPEKLTIVFGMFGHDWIIDTEGKPLGTAESVSLNNIKQLVNRCIILRCQRSRDDVSSEMKVTYTDEQERRHIIWYEDEESVKKKKALAEKNGIHSFAYWAYGYY